MLWNHSLGSHAGSTGLWIPQARRCGVLGLLPSTPNPVPLTVSHLALLFSSSKRANSRRSWMVMSSFQMSRAERPMSRMAPVTESRTTRTSGPFGQSGAEKGSVGGGSAHPGQLKAALGLPGHEYMEHLWSQEGIILLCQQAGASILSTAGSVKEDPVHGVPVPKYLGTCLYGGGLHPSLEPDQGHDRSPLQWGMTPETKSLCWWKFAPSQQPTDTSSQPLAVCQH